MHDPASPSSSGPAFSAFRNVSACNRCRVRKNRCDQRLPACAACEKAKIPCVGYDPITKKEVPRSYVYYLEERTRYLESLLTESGIPFAPADAFVVPRTGSASSAVSHGNGSLGATTGIRDDHIPPQAVKQDGEQERVDKLVSSASKIAVHATSDARFLGSASGISFARVVFAAIKSVANASGAASERHTGRRGSIKSETGSGILNRTPPTSMRDSFFGLDTKSNAKPAPFPSRDLGYHLVNLYFQHANPQFPILHRLEFMDLVQRAYEKGDRTCTERERYLLNMVFAIGAGIIVGKPLDLHGHSRGSESPDGPEPPAKRRRVAEEQRPPEEYHAAAIIHLEAALGSNVSEGITGNLEELQSVLLLACFALLRPVPPGLWYIVGVALRLAIDLGLHADDGIDIDRPEHPNMDYQEAQKQRLASSPGMGRKQYLADFRRRLWWCCYSFDRLVSSVVGRPFGIQDQMISTAFPSILDDIYISPAGITYPAEDLEPISYKRVSFHYFRLRLLHSEILQVLSHRQNQLLRARGVQPDNKYIHSDLPSPFLESFGGSFRIWREDLDRRLWEWQDESPKQNETGVQFSPLFLELNYWQTVLMLYRQSLSIPVALANDARAATENVTSPVLTNIETKEDADMVFMKVAQAGQNVLKLYRKLHRKYLVNYTYLATHHLFMAGISFLYAIWHSPLVRSHLTLDDVDFTVLAATSVLDDLVVFCPPAKNLRDAFSKMTKTTIKMCIATTGFGSQVQLDKIRPSDSPSNQTALMSSTGPSPLPGVSLETNTSAAATPANPNFAYAPQDQQRSYNQRRLEMPRFDAEDWGTLFSPEDMQGRLNRSFGERLQQLSRQGPRQYGVTQQMSYSAGDAINANLPVDPSLMPMTAAAVGQTSSSTFDPASSQQQDAALQALKSPWSDSLDFLETISIPDPTAPTAQAGLGGIAPSGQAPFDPSSIDMGVGFAWDGSVPGAIWEDGDAAPVDLFDGFFFGGNIPATMTGEP